MFSCIFVPIKFDKVDFFKLSFKNYYCKVNILGKSNLSKTKKTMTITNRREPNKGKDKKRTRLMSTITQRQASSNTTYVHGK